MKRILYISLAITLVILTGCKKSDSTQVDKSVARLTAFAFVKNDTMPGLSKAVFTIEERNDTGLVWNKDSMLYGTSLKRVVPRFMFATTPSAAFLKMRDTVYTLTGYDTLDFTRTPIYLSIRSQDKTNTKTYEIRATVHQADPDLYTWQELESSIYGNYDSEQRVVEFGKEFVMLASDGFYISAWRSPDGINWSLPTKLNGLPAGTKVRQIVCKNDTIKNEYTLYYGQDSTLYSSTDIYNWTAKKMSRPIATMLLYWNDLVWMLTGTDERDYELAYLQADTITPSGLMPANEFPISDFATVTFLSSSMRERAMIIGGFAENGKSLNTRWNLEYSSHIKENNGYRLQEFSMDRSSFKGLTGISIVYYNNQLLLFGGVDDQAKYFGRDILMSKDEGLTWTKADTAKNQLPEAYQARQKQNAIVRDNNIYLFGGQDAKTTYSDVYKGRLNSIDWKK